MSSPAAIGVAYQGRLSAGPGLQAHDPALPKPAGEVCKLGGGGGGGRRGTMAASLSSAAASAVVSFRPGLAEAARRGLPGEPASPAELGRDSKGGSGGRRCRGSRPTLADSQAASGLYGLLCELSRFLQTARTL
ncbi:hypothetical protein N2152v2_004544 [Parachlorella kessleri]